MIGALQLGAAYLALVLLTGSGPESGPDEHRLELPAKSASTISVGHPYHGKLKHGVKLPDEGSHHIVQRSTKARRWNYGTTYLIRAVLVAAERVNRDLPGGVPLEVGNLSKKGGGDIKLSMSHNTGRDVDIAYYTATSDGTSTTSHYHKFAADGRSKGAPTRYQLDIARNWAWVRAMVTSQEAETQWVIVAPYIERLLLEHAKRAGEPDWLLRQAELVMMLPSWAKLHDNHIHLRVLCSPEDWKRGCNNGGPVWSWNTKMVAAMDAELDTLRPELKSDDADHQVKALRMIAKRGLGIAVPDVAPLLQSANATVRAQALKTVGSLLTEANAMSVLKIARWCDQDAAVQLLTKAIALAGPDALPTARELLDGRHPVKTADLSRKDRKKLRKSAKRIITRFANVAGGAVDG
ncbi:MAG: penicillin-insensitive murein endopeptidase [Myxococcota bacterium]|jgi:penicillin-insensitive murein endopeptidase